MRRHITRRRFIKTGAVALAAAAVGKLGDAVGVAQADAAKVFFTRDLSVDGLLSVYSRVDRDIGGKVGIKLHPGEPNGSNLVPLSLTKGLQSHVPDSALVECNVMYGSPRKRTETHLETFETNGFDFCPVDILDADGDATLPITGVKELLSRPLPAIGEPLYTAGDHLTDIAVGKHLLDYDSLVVFTHFKGHAMSGFGGALKNVAVGCASGETGKRQIHGEGWTTGPLFLERMVEAGKGVVDHFAPRITYVNVLMNISVDCDCHVDPAPPAMDDIGILASTDILAIDAASVDLVYAMPEDQRHDLAQRIKARGGVHQLEYMQTLRMGHDQYDLIEI